MRWANFLLLVLVAVATGQQENPDAEKLFKDMEEKLTKAETLQVTYEVKGGGVGIKGGIRAANWKGRLVFTRKKQLRYEFESDLSKVGFKAVFVSNGATLKRVVEVDGKKVEKDTFQDKMPTDVVPNLTRLLARSSLHPMIIGLVFSKNDKDRANLEKDNVVTQFRFKEKAKVGSVETNVITYEMKDRGGELSVTLWLDAKSNLPLKRTIQQKRTNVLVTDHYRGWKLDEKIDAKVFTLPNE